MSRPPTPSADRPAFSTEWRFHPLTCPTELIEDYRPGKYHPVHFGDTLKNPFVSKHELAILDVLSHSALRHPGKSNFMTLVDFFQHEGPNYIHRYLVFDFMGPYIGGALEDPSKALEKVISHNKFPIWMVKSILYQTLQGISFLHESGVAHSDLQQGNLLFSVKDLNDVEETDLARNDQIPDPVRRKDG
ncbi:hypothetical protein N7466_009539 [Penicillium verhagenii]|uniref:uncharacterized protein n=1 Tax=Penicillium verhagenii TaxID=1562060 RepID=UPI0025456202|nr:uncharacterized protein N7466_009539 [Penicillium verhagenii]KAJ5921213.1 hypothetical protein N7466_009539 [Penicillium verhagenii]